PSPEARGDRPRTRRRRAVRRLPRDDPRSRARRAGDPQGEQPSDQAAGPLPAAVAIPALEPVRCRQKHRPGSNSLYGRVIQVSGDSACDDHALTAQYSPPRAATGHRHSTRPLRTPTYQSNLSTVGSQCPGISRSFSPTTGGVVSLPTSSLPCSFDAPVAHADIPVELVDRRIAMPRDQP